MKRYPGVPGREEVGASFFDGGHLCVQELVAGELLRFQVQASGAVRFGTRRRELDPGAVPPRFQHAVSAVREHLDVDAVRESVEEPASVTFFAVATHAVGVPYDWDRLPSVLGVDVWDDTDDGFLAVDAMERAFDAFELPAVNALEREVHVRDYDSTAPPMPPSAWYDGPVAGVVLRKKTGDRVAIQNPALDDEPAEGPADGQSTVVPASAAEAAERVASRERIDRVVDGLESAGRDVSFDAVYDRVLASGYREERRWLLDDDGSSTGARGRGFDLGEFRSAVADRTQALLAAT